MTESSVGKVGRREEEGKTESDGGDEGGKGEVRECSCGYPGLTI